MPNSKLRISIKSVLDSLCHELRKAVQLIYIQRGLKKNSDLVKSVEVKRSPHNEIIVFANFYFEFVDRGRKRFTRKIPLSALIKFIKKNRIKLRKGQSINQLAVIFQNSIYRKGIKGKKIIKPVEKITEEIMIERLSEFFTVEIEDDIIRTLNRI